MNSFSIAQLSQFSGIKAHTIRIWEQRYNALQPKRTEGNTRLYNGQDLKRLLNIVSLMGHSKVSELCSMDDKALNLLLSELYTQKIEEKPDPFVSQLIAAGIEFNEPSFQKILSHCLLRFGVSETYKKIIYPLLNRMGLMWASGGLPPAHEHFMSNIIRQKLMTAIDSLPLQNEKGKKWLLFLPEDEYHEIGLLMARYVLNLHGEKVFYLGQSVPLSTLSLSFKDIKPDALFLFFTHNDILENINLYLCGLSESFKNARIYISGNEKLISNVHVFRNVSWIKTIDDLEKAV